MSNEISPESTHRLPVLRLKKNEHKRLRAGHLWVYSNEINTKHSPLTNFSAGELVRLEDNSGHLLGTAYVNPQALLCARLLSRRIEDVQDVEFWRLRIRQALALRMRLYAEPCYRLIYGESDFCPGLVVDRYSDVLVVQTATAGMERLLDVIVQALQMEIQPKGILLRNDGSSRERENLPQYQRVVAGEVPDEVLIHENGAQFMVPLTQGQKTGWFYDHRENRARLCRYVSGLRVLDLFSYTGAWGIQAALAGAKSVLCVDSSASALQGVQDNAELNKCADRVETRQGDVFDVLRELIDAGERFDVVILDPPAFIKRRKDQKAGFEAYQRLNERAMRVLVDDGLLLSASCSFHLAAHELKRILLRASRQQGAWLSILEQGQQGPDHPVHPAIPETSYLKAILARVLRPEAGRK